VSTEELGVKFFSRERVRNRMVKRAAEVWGFSEPEMDDFDPLVILLMEACAVEFEKMAGEIGRTRHRMMERLAQLLYPGTISVAPAYGLMQARSSEPSAILYPDAQFTYKPLSGDRKRDAAEIYFSPAYATKIVDGSIQFIATGRELFGIEEGIQKRSIAVATGRNIDLQHTLWMGVDLNEDLTELDGISFFFNWINELESKDWYPYLPYTHWSLCGVSLEHKAGLSDLEPGDDAASRLKMEFDAMKKIERSIAALFRRHYICLGAGLKMDHTKVKRSLYPPAFEQLFDSSTLKTFKEPLLWIEVRFPPAVTLEALDTVHCSMNAVPVLNRKLNKINYKLGPGMNIIPLETEECFLSVKEIEGPDGLEPETYSLRYGINRFDERDAYETLVNFAEVIKEESSFFSSLGEDFMTQNIREMKQVLTRLEEKVRMQQKKPSPYPYLVVKTGLEGAPVSVQFWSCDGESGGRIPAGSRLLPYRNSHVRTDALFLITPTYGGRDKFNDAGKIDHYKKLLVTHHRIVTEEDLRRVVEAELGKSAREVEYKKAYIKSPRPEEGFIRCMQIIVTPAPGSFDGQDWQQRLRELQLTLEKQSTGNIPFQIKLVTPDPII